MDQQFRDIVDQIVKERTQGTPQATNTTDPAQGDQQPGFFTRLYNEVTGDHPAPVEGVDFGTAPDAGTVQAASRTMLQGAESQTELPRAVMGGAAQAIFQTRDFMAGLTGESTDPANKTDLRKAVEADYAAVTSKSVPSAVAGPISQFVTGLVGAGKLMAPLKAISAVKNAGIIGKAVYETARGALAAGVVMDPHEDRLSNVIQSFPALENPVNDFLSAKPDDSNAEGRLKNALEGAGMDLVVGGAFVLGLKALKLAKAGDTEGARTILNEMATQKVTEAPVDATAAAVPEVADVAQMTPTAGVVDSRGLPKVRVKAGREVVPADMAEATGIDTGASISEAVPRQAPDVMTADPAPLPNPEKVTTLRDSITPEDMNSIIKGTEFDLQAIDQAGSRKDALLQGHKFAEAGSIPWQKLQTPEDITTLISNTSSVLRPELNAAKGGDVLKDATVGRMVRNASKFYNEDPTAIIGQIVEAGDAAAGMVRNMETGYLVSTRMFMDAWDVVNKVRWGNLAEFGGDAAGAVQEAKRRLNIAFQVYSASQSIRSNTGRAMRRMRSEFGITEESLKSLNSMDDAKFIDLMDSTGGDPKKIKELAQPGFMRRVLDEAQFSMRNGLLWNYPTHVINTTTNVFMQLARPLEKAIGATVMGSRGHPIRDLAAKEFYYTAAALSDGWKAGAEAWLRGDIMGGFRAMRDNPLGVGVEAFIRGDSKMAPHASDWLDTNDGAGYSTANKPLLMPNFKPFDSIENLWHNLHASSLYRNVAGLPTRALGAQDEFFKTLRYRAVVQARAAQSADQLGLKGQDYKDFMESKLADAYDADGKAMDREALQEAQTSTFNQELIPGTLGAGIRNLRSQVPVLGLVLPFVKTPVNVLRYASKYTPGLNMLQGEYRAMLMGKQGVEQQAQAIGQMSLGALFMGTTMTLAHSGRITGGGPADPKLKQELTQQGWKPYSVRISDGEGGETYVPYGRFDPIGLVMGMTADLYNIYTTDPENKNITDLATASVMSLAKNFGERTFLMNANQLIDALSDPENKMEKFLGGMAASTVPMSSAMKAYVNGDPYLRETRGLMDRVMSVIPGLSERLPAKRDVFGEPVTKKLGLTTDYEPNSVEREHNRIILETGEGLSAPSPVRNGVDLRDIKLPSGMTAYDQLQEYSQRPVKNDASMRAALTLLISSQLYEAMPDGEIGVKGTKLNAFAGIVQKYREAAYKRLLSENPEIGKLTRKKAVEAGATLLNNITGDPGAGANLLKSLGYEKGMPSGGNQ